MESIDNTLRNTYLSTKFTSTVRKHSIFNKLPQRLGFHNGSFCFLCVRNIYMYIKHQLSYVISLEKNEETNVDNHYLYFP